MIFGKVSKKKLMAMFFVSKNVVFQEILPKNRCLELILCKFDLCGVKDSESEGLHELFDCGLCPDRISGLVETG